MVEEPCLFMCYQYLPEDIKTTGLYLLLKSQDPVPMPSSMTEARTTLPLVFETGTMSHNLLQGLDQSLRHLYTPLFMSFGQKSAEDIPEDKEADEEDNGKRQGVAFSGSKMLLRDELLIYTQKFSSQIQQTIQQVLGEVKLDVPELALNTNNPALVAKDPALVAQLEGVVEKWSQVITATLDEQFQKYPQGLGPLAEVDFWKDRNAALNALYLQLLTPNVQTILSILKTAGSAAYSTFEVTRIDLNKYYVEAKDNVKFLGTLERHFKNIAHGASFAAVVDTIPAMMNSLRMVWVISRHYNTDERMVPLMERIAYELCSRVSRIINITTIFKLVHVDYRPIYKSHLGCYVSTVVTVQYLLIQAVHVHVLYFIHMLDW